MKKILCGFLLLFIAVMFCSCDKEIKVTFDPNNGTDEVQTVVISSDNLPPISAPKKEGYYFGGWWTEKEGGEQWLFNEKKATDGLILYAHWLNTMLTVNFDNNLPSLEVLNTPAIDTLSLTHSSKIPIPDEPELKDDIYYFVGWSKSPTQYTPWIFNKHTIIENTVLYAYWEKYATVSFDLSIYEIEEIEGNLNRLSDKKVRLGNTINTLDEIKAIDQKNLFEGWYTDENCLNRWDFETVIFNDITLYANWDEAIRVSFDINAPESASVNWRYPIQYIIRKNMSLWNAYTRNDIKNVEWLLRESLVPHDQNYLYAVNTWYYLNSQGEEIVFDNDTVLTEDTTIYAKWRQANYYKFDGKYHELFHPQTPDTQNTNQFSNFGMLPYRSSGYANYFVGWFYKNNPNMEYFGEKVEPHTEFVSRYFKLTDESNFILEKQGDKNYMTLKDTFSSKDLVLPDYIAVYDEVKKSYTYVYDFIIDLTKFSNIKNIVFASYHMTFLNSVKIISNQNNIDINFFSSSQYYKIYGNYVYSVDTYFIEEYYQMRYQHIDDQNRTTDFKYSVLTLEGSVLKDLTTPLAMLPCENTDIIKNPIILEAKFMSYYREINNKVLFCDNSYLDSVRSKIFNGLFSGSIVYDISILQNKKDNYLIQNNELIYYMNRQADLDTVEKKLNVDLRDNPFLNIKKINTNSIIFNINYITEYTVNLYLSQNIEKIESRAIERSTTMNIYLYGQCPEIIFRANDSTDTYAQDGSVAPINIPNNLPHRNKISYMDLIYYFNSQFSDSYSAWASELSYSYQNVYFRTFES